MSRSESPTFRYWLLLGLGLHVAVGLVIEPAPRSGVAAPPQLRAIDLYLEEEAAAPASPGLEHSGVEGSGVEGSGARPPAADDSTPAQPPSPPERLARVSRDAALAARGSQRAPSAQSSPGAPASSGAPAAAAGGEPPPEVRVTPPPPSLSLDALGVGTYTPFLGAVLAAPAQRAAHGAQGAAVEAGRRLENSIETALAKRDQRIGLGPEGAAVAAVETLVMQGSTAPNGNATLFVRTDADGKVVHVEVREASGDGPEWERIARELVRALGAARTRVPPGSRGVSFQLRVASREQLPSGAAPGLEIGLFGLTLKRGRGDNATRIGILEPKITTQKVPLPHDPLQREVDALVVSLVPFMLRGDPVDIAAPARRVVRAHLGELTVH